MIKKIVVLCSLMIFSSMLSMQDEPKSQLSSLNIVRHGGDSIIIELPGCDQLTTKKLTKNQKRNARRKRLKAQRAEKFRKDISDKKDIIEHIITLSQEVKEKPEQTNIKALKLLKLMLDDLPDDEFLWTKADQKIFSYVFEYLISFEGHC